MVPSYAFYVNRTFKKIFKMVNFENSLIFEIDQFSNSSIIINWGIDNFLNLKINER